MIPMSELVKEPGYRKFLETMPKTPIISRDKAVQKSPPWVVYVQIESGGKWGKKEFWKYTKAFKFFRACMKQGVHDATINNKRVPTPPPSRMVRIKGKYITGSDGVRRQATTSVEWQMPALLRADYPDHHWCLYCRRPVLWKFYSKHPRLGPVDPFIPRCCICGVSARIGIASSSKMYRPH